jgi:hypothetical protein
MSKQKIKTRKKTRQSKKANDQRAGKSKKQVPRRRQEKTNVFFLTNSDRLLETDTGFRLGKKLLLLEKQSI